MIRSSQFSCKFSVNQPGFRETSKPARISWNRQASQDFAEQVHRPGLRQTRTSSGILPYKHSRQDFAKPNRRDFTPRIPNFHTNLFAGLRRVKTLAGNCPNLLSCCIPSTRAFGDAAPSGRGDVIQTVCDVTHHSQTANQSGPGAAGGRPVNTLYTGADGGP